MADTTPPQAPTQLAANIPTTDGNKIILRVTWMDNCDWEDEYMTVFTFNNVANTVFLTAYAYADHYDEPKGSTGIRSVNLLLPMSTGAIVFVAQSVRLVEVENSGNPWGKITAWSPKSVRAVITEGPPSIRVPTGKNWEGF